MGDLVTQHLARAARAIKPLGLKTARVLLVSCFIIVLLMELNETCGGIVSTAGEWIWDNILVYKTVNFGLGMLITYLVMYHIRKREESTVRGQFMRTAPIKLDLETLESHARKHGIELDLRSDPRISKRNPEVAVEEEQKIETTTPLQTKLPDPPTGPKKKKQQG